METKLISLGEPAASVFEALSGFLDGMANGCQGSRQGRASLTRVVLSPGQTVELGCVTLPLYPVSTSALRERYHLSPTQARVAGLLGARLTNSEIAAVLGCATGTVRSHVAWVYNRLGAHHRDEIAYLLSDPSLQCIPSPPVPQGG